MLKLRNSKMMWSFLIFGTLLASIPVVILSVYIYVTSFRAIQENTHVMQRELLDTVRSDIEQVIRTTDQQLFDMSLVSSTVDALNASNLKYNYTTFENIRLLKNRMIEMQSLITQRTGVEVEYTLVNTQGEWLQNNDGFFQYNVQKIQPMLAIVQQVVDGEIPDRTPYGTWLKSQGGMLHMARSVWRGSTTYGVLVISISEEKLFSRLRSIPEVENMLVLDGRGEMLAGYQAPSSRMDMAELAQRLHETGGDGYQTIRLSNGGWVVTVTSSDYLDWKYVYATDLAAIQPRSNILIVSVLAITASVLLVIALLFFMFTRRMYRPIARLVQKVATETDPADGTDEFATVSNYIDQVHASYSLLQQVQEDRKLQYSRQFLLQLIDGSIVYDWAVRRAEMLGLPLTAAYYCLFVLEADSGIGTDGEMQDDQVRLVLMRDIANELFPSAMDNLHEIVEHRFLMLHRLDADSPEAAAEAARAHAARLMQVVSASLRATLRCVVAGPFEALMLLPEMYAEAIHTLENRIGIGDDNIAFSTSKGMRRRVYSKEAYRELMKAIGKRDKQGMEACLEAYFSPIVCAKLPKEEEIFERLSIATNILAVIKPSTFPTLAPLLLPETDPCRWIYENLLSAAMGAAEPARPLSISEMIVEIIEKEYQTPLTLEYCAEKIGYNLSYASRIFKQQTGTSFKEYLYLYRIQKSQEMLVRTDMQISEISNLLCYNNAQNFIRVFKKVVGITPGAYRTKAKEGGQGAAHMKE